MQSKITLRFHLSPISEWVRSKSQTTGENVEQGEHSSVDGKSANLNSHFEKQFDGFLLEGPTAECCNPPSVDSYLSSA